MPGTEIATIGLRGMTGGAIDFESSAKASGLTLAVVTEVLAALLPVDGAAAFAGGAAGLPLALAGGLASVIFLSVADVSPPFRSSTPWPMT